MLFILNKMMNTLFRTELFHIITILAFKELLSKVNTTAMTKYIFGVCVFV